MARKGIYKRGDVWWIRYAALGGKMIRKSTGSNTYKDAEYMLNTEKKAVQEGKPERKLIANYSFEELAEKYTTWMTGRHKSADSKAYRIKQMKSRFGSLPLRHFNTMLVEQYQTDLTTKGLKPGSVNKNISLLKAMFNKAVEWEMVEEDTLKRVRKVKLSKESNKRLRFLIPKEAQALVSACDDHLKPIVVTALHTGMRRGEILKLTWEQVDLTHGFITLTDTKNGEGREVPIDSTLRETFNRLPRRFVEVVKKDGKDGEKVKELVPYVFHDSITLKPYKSVKRSFATALKDAGAALETAGIKDFRFHDLRHTFASQLVMSGVDLTTVRDLLGHKDIKMTLRYAHLAPAHKAKAVNVLDNLFNPSPSCTPAANCTITAQKTEKELAFVS